MDAPTSLAEWFARLRDMTPDAQSAQLATLDAALASRLRALLAADADDDARIAAAIVSGPLPDLDDETGVGSIGAWRILGELGRGGMGVVLLGEREIDGTSQRGAIKLMRGRVQADDRLRFRRERQILATLDHPDIARLIDGGESESGHPYLVIEHVRGDTLAHRLKQGPIDVRTAIGWIERVAAAVQHAHQHLVIHRDLKPANIMITPEGSVKLLDFGVAKLIEPGTGDADASTRVFTPGYASPEQLAGRTIGTRSDVFSLGRVLSEVAAHAREDSDLLAIIHKATMEDPADRYDTMAGFHEDLVAWRTGQPVRATSLSWRYRFGKWLRRHPVAAMAAAVALVVIATLSWRWIDALSDAAAARDRAEIARANAELQLTRSRAVVDFYARMFAGVAPEHALGESLAPTELLARAERLLAEAPPADPELQRELSASLGVLYQRIGDGTQAVRLLQAGLAGEAPTDPIDGQQRANREHTLALILFDLGRLDESLAATERAQALRQKFAAGDPRTAVVTDLLLVQQYLGLKRIDDAKAVLARVDAGFTQFTPTQAEQIEREQMRAILAIDEGRFQDAATFATNALSWLQADATLDRTRVIELERTLARAQQGLGELDAASEAFSRAIAAQRTYIGDVGTRAMGLHNDHAILLATLGRFREAMTEYEQAADVFARSGGPAVVDNPRHQNNLCDAESGLGRYDDAVRHCARALALLIAEERPLADPERLLVESNLARARGYAGAYSAGLDTLIELGARAREAQGAQSFTATLQEFRAIRLALLADRVDEARAFADRTIKSIDVVFPNASPWRVRGWRAVALVAIAEGRWADATAALDRASIEAETVLPEHHPLRAQVLMDRAVVFDAMGQRGEAVAALEKALPDLRSCCEPGEIDRAEAEKLAVRWNVL